MDEDDDDGPCRLKVVKPIYMFPHKAVNYHGTGMTKKLQKLRDKNPYASERKATYRMFWATFQQDYYAIVIIKKPKITHMAQYVDWMYMESKNDPIFTELSTVCGHQRVKELMGFRQDWNREIIAQFYSTVHFGYIEEERAMMWMTNGNKHAIRFSRFLSLFGLGADDKDYPKLHNGGPLEPEALYFMYPRDQRANVGHMKGLYTYYSVLNSLLGATIAPRDGNPSDISRFVKNLMIALRLGVGPFSVGDYIWQEINYLSEDPKKIYSYSPYIMYMIEKVTKIEFPKDVTHKPLRPNPVKNPIVPSPEREPEITAEEGAEARVDWQQFKQQPTAQADTGLTGATHRSDRWGPGQYGRPKKSTSPLRRFVNLLFGMCKSQYDIEVEQQWMRIGSKKERDTMKQLHNHFGFQPPRSPILPLLQRLRSRRLIRG
jgi:hypothetical protein